MKQIKRSCMLIVALALAGFMGLQPARAGVIAAVDVAAGSTSHTSFDGLVTLTPYGVGLTNGGSFGSNESSLFGVVGGVNDNALDDADGNPFTTEDREAIDIDLDATVGLSQVAFVWARADGWTVTNGVMSGVEISGFLEDPGFVGINSTYTNGTLYFGLFNWSGTPKVYNFDNPAASAGQTLRMSVNDFDQAGPRLSISYISYDEPGSVPTPPAGLIVAGDFTNGAPSYTTGDGMVSLTPYAAVSNLVPGVFGVNAPSRFFGIQGTGNDNAINDADGNPLTTDDREALDIELDGSAALSQIRFVWSRADGPISNGVPSGIEISGFVEDPEVWTDSSVTNNTYTNGTLYLDYSYDYGNVRTFSFSNLVASAGQTLRLSANDWTESNAQAVVFSIGYDDYITAQPAVLSIELVSGQLSVTAQNMAAGGGVINTLQGSTDLTSTSWTDIGSTTDVDQVTWPVSDSEPNRFYRVKSE